MPRLARLDAPGVLHHIMIRGIERRKTFRDNKDRDDFIERLSIILPETDTSCYAWALMSNYHLLLRTNRANLSKSMQWFGVTYTRRFNNRHLRSGHLFQGRFKGMLVQNDAYMMESCPATFTEILYGPES